MASIWLPAQPDKAVPAVNKTANVAKRIMITQLDPDILKLAQIVLILR